MASDKHPLLYGCGTTRSTTILLPYNSLLPVFRLPNLDICESETVDSIPNLRQWEEWNGFLFLLFFFFFFFSTMLLNQCNLPHTENMTKLFPMNGEFGSYLRIAQIYWIYWIYCNLFSAERFTDGTEVECHHSKLKELVKSHHAIALPRKANNGYFILLYYVEDWGVITKIY